MRYIIFILLLIGSIGANAQFPNTDSLRKFNNKYVGNSPINSFTNLRLNTLLYGMINHIDSARLGTTGSVGVDTLYALNDSTIRYKKNGVFYNAPLPSYARVVNDTTIIINGDTVTVGGSGGSTVSAAAPIEKDVEDTIRLTYNTEGLRIKDDALDAKAKVFDSEASLRALTQADTNSVYRVRINRDYGEFKYDPDDASSADDSAMVLVDAAGNRFKRVINDVIYPEDFGAKGDGTTDDAAAFNKMYRWIEASASNIKEVRHKKSTYLFGSTVYLPGNIPINGKLLKLKIIGNATIYKTTAAITILERWPTSQTQALNEYISDYALELSGIRFEGNSTSGQVGARLGAMYTPVLEGCHFASLDTGVVAAFWLNGRIKNNFFTQNKSVSFKGASGFGYWTGATTSNSAFNINEFSGNRIFSATGSYAGLYFFAADGLLIKDHISEGFNPRYDIYNDSEATTVVNGNTYRNIWFETTGGVYAKNTCFYLRNNGTTVIDGLQNDYADTLVKFVSTAGGSEFIFENIQYYNTTGKILDAGGLYTGGSSITVSNCSYNFSKIFTDTTYWVGGVIGFNGFNQAFKPSGAGYTLQSNTAINIEPYFGTSLPNANRSVTVHGGFNFGTDNQFYIGGNGANVRPNRISIGTGGIRVDKSAAFGIGFADNAANPTIYWKYLNDSLSHIVGTGAIRMPLGNTAQRPSVGQSSSLRYNTDLARFEFANGSNYKQLLSNDDTVSVSSRINIVRDSVTALRTRVAVNTDSLFSHNTRILKNVDSLFSHNLRIIANKDSLVSHNSRILLVNDTLASHNNRLIALENTTGGGGTSSELLVKPGDANYTITTSTENLSIVYFTALTADRTVTLPDPATNTGRKFSIKHGGSGLFNILFSANIYENSTTFVTSLGVGQSIQFMSDGTQYIITR